MYSSGNGLCFMNRSGKHVKSIPSYGSGVGPIATAPQVSIVVYAESTLNPKIFAVSYPSCELIATFKGMFLSTLLLFVCSHLHDGFADGAKLQYVSLAISTSGKMLATLSGVPDFLLTLWSHLQTPHTLREIFVFA